MCNKSNYGDAMKQFVEYSQIEKAAKQEKQKLQKELIEYINNNKKEYQTSENKYVIEYDGLKLTYQIIKQNRFDNKVFEIDNPEMYKKYCLVKEKSDFRIN